MHNVIPGLARDPFANPISVVIPGMTRDPFTNPNSVVIPGLARDPLVPFHYAGLIDCEYNLL